MKILDKQQITQKIKRLAYEIYECNYGEKEITLAGINNNGMRFAELLKAELESISNFKVDISQLQVNPANPVAEDIEIATPVKELRRGIVIIVDDVANTGRTLFYAFKPLLDIVPKRVETAVLIDRKHKSFPVKVDYVGLSLATTLKENIDVDLEGSDWSVSLN